MPSTENSEAHKVLSRWWRVSLRAKGVAVLAVPMAVLFAVLFAIHWVEGDVHETELTVDRAYAIRAQMVQIHGSLVDAEESLTGYLATGQDQFLKLYNAARTAIAQSTAVLNALVGPDPRVAADLGEIRRLTTANLELLESLRAGGPGKAPAASLRERDRTAMTAAQAQITLFNDYEEGQFTHARYLRDLARRRLFTTVIFCGILGPFGALFTHLLVAGRMVRRLRVVEENARRLAHGLPLEPSPAGTDEIASLGKQLENAAYLLREREREVHENASRYRDLFDQAPVPYEEADREGVIRRFNQAMCSLLKCSPEQMVGRHAWDFVAPNRQDEFRAALIERITKGVEAGPWEVDYALDDGTRLGVEIRENLVRNESGEVTGVIRSLTDITQRNLSAMVARKVEQYAVELRHKNEQLARALEAARAATVGKSRFLASVSHELRTPLNGIIGFSELLYDGKLGQLSADHHEVMGDILTSSRHLLRLINDILDLSKVEAGRMEFRPEPNQLVALAFEVRDVVRPMAEKKGIDLSVDAPSDLIATIDPARFKQVLYNYLSNAVKFTPERGHVAVRIHRDGAENFRLDVEDTGIGIGDEEIPRLFQEFGQLPNSRRAEQGTGLGLALTRHIVEAQGGVVSVVSKPGKGSVFSATLPLESVVRGSNS